MKFILYFILVCTAGLLTQKLCAQPYFFTNYKVADGLSNNAIGCITRDKDGYIWAGTEAGLNRFNGYDFTVYKSLAGDTSTLNSNVIHCLLTDHDGKVWIGTTGGICLYDNKSNTFIRMSIRSSSKSLGTYETFCLLQDSKENIWAGISDFGLVQYDTKQNAFVKPIENMPPLSNNLIDGIAEDKDGALWMSNYNSLVYFNPRTNDVKEFANLLSSDHTKFQGLNVSNDLSDNNFLWIMTWGSGLVHFNKLTGEFVSYKFHLNGTKNLHNIVFNIHYIEKNKIWMATSEGMMAFNPDKKKFEGFVRDSINEDPVVNGEIHNFFKDDEGITWIGTSSGLCNIHPAKQNFMQQLLWRNSPVMEYYFDEASDKMYGTRIYQKRALIICYRKLNRQEEYAIPEADELQAEPFSILKDDHGLIWLGTTKGIYTFDELQKKFTFFKIEDQLHIPDRSPHIRNGIKTRDGKIWFAYYSQGLMMIDADTKKITAYFYNPADKSSFPLYAPTGIAEGKEKTIYICDEKRGVAILDYGRNSTVHYNAEEKKYSMLKNAVDIGVDKDEIIWVTTKNNGLIRIDKSGEITAYTRDEFGNIIDEQSNIAIDDSGKIWLTASNGIYRFSPETKSFMHFTLEDGLPARTVPIERLNNGKIAFKTTDILCFNPLEISTVSRPLHVHLSSCLVNGKVSAQNNFIDRLDTIRLEHNENNITFEFAAPNFRNSSSTLYSYRLEGIDNDWSAPVRTRTVNFSQLPPGNFLLRLRAGITGLDDRLPEKRILIQIIPAWWQTSWFQWLAVIALVSALFFSIRFFLSIRYGQKIAQLERQREIENVRMRISRDIHDEIGSGLTKIKLMSRNLSRAKEESVLNETTTKISLASDELIQNLGEIVWTVNPANDTLENIFAFVRNYVSRLFDDNPDIKLKLDFTDPAQIPDATINPEAKRNLLLILKETLTNIFKHSQATEVSILLFADKSKIEMCVSDNGKGISAENQNGFGNGLKNMQKRAESIGAEFTAGPSETGGTEITILIPLTSIINTY